MRHQQPDGRAEQDDAAPATPAETRALLLGRSRRDFAPIAKIFVQAPSGTTPRHGPLSTFVRNRDVRALRALLLLYGIISNGKEGWDTKLPIGAWARAFDITTTTPDPTSLNATSKILTRLEERRLITRERVGRDRQVRITLCREDGSGKPYTRPGHGNTDRYLKLPHAYWTDGWYDKLDLPATAMLLVSLHEKPGFRLPTERMPEWYGWSADTAERGFATLIDLGILERKARLIKTPLSPTGQTRVNEYALLKPFAHRAARKAARTTTTATDELSD